MGKFGRGLSDAQIRLARRIEAAGLASFSRAIKALQRGEKEQIAAWKRQLKQE